MAKKIPPPLMPAATSTPADATSTPPRSNRDSSVSHPHNPPPAGATSGQGRLHGRTRHLSVGEGNEGPPDSDWLTPIIPRRSDGEGSAVESSPNSPSCAEGTGGGGARPRTVSFSGTTRFERPRRPTPPTSRPVTPTLSPREIRGRRRRLDSLHLDPPRQTDNHSDNDHFFHFGGFLGRGWECPPQKETILQGEELYLHFFHERLRNEGLSAGADTESDLEPFHNCETHLQLSPPRTTTHQSDEGGCGSSPGGAAAATRRSRTLSMNLENFQDPIWRQTGRDLQVLADQFARSHERLLVRQLAEEVEFSTLDKQKFITMLSELFKGGQVTRERILVLFFFCSDVAIFAIRSGAGKLISSLTEWSLLFIKDQVCSWVQNNGGWREVLRSGMNLVQQSLVVGTCAMLIACCAIYIRKNLAAST